MARVPWPAIDWLLTTYRAPVSGRWVTRLILVLKDRRWIRIELHPEELAELSTMAAQQLLERQRKPRRKRR